MNEARRVEHIGDACLILADCMDVMRDMPDKAFELAIVDPPYGLKKSELIPGSKISSTGVPRRQWNQKPENITMGVPGPEYFKELFRVSKNQIVWGENFFPNMGPGRIIWNKHNPVLSEAELAYHSFGIGVYIFDYTWSGFCTAGEHDTERFHPTQKPVALYKWLLSRYAKPGDKILDTHAGSGSSVIACLDMGYLITWIEKDEDYYAAALERIEIAYRQPRLFDDPKKAPEPQNFNFSP